MAQIETVMLSVERIHPNSWNPNRQTPRVTEAERESIEAFGFVDPVTVRPHPEIEGEWELVDGEHRWREAPGLGYAEIPAVVLDLDDAAARKLTVVLNEVRGDADVVLMGKLLGELQALVDPEQFALALPFTDAELQHLLALSDEDWDRFDASAYDPDAVAAPPAEYEVVLTFPSKKRHKQFLDYVEILRRELGKDSVTDAIYAGVEQQAKVAILSE